MIQAWLRRSKRDESKRGEEMRKKLVQAKGKKDKWTMGTGCRRLKRQGRQVKKAEEGAGGKEGRWR